MKLKVEQLWKQSISNFKFTDTYWYLKNRNGILNKNRNIILIYAR